MRQFLALAAVLVSGCATIQSASTECAAGNQERCDWLETKCVQHGKAKACRALSQVAHQKGDAAREQEFLKQACFAKDFRACNQAGIDMMPVNNKFSIHND